MDRLSHSPQTGETSHLLVEFLEVAITSIVFLKGIYPSGAFERRRYLNLVVHRARHPHLNHYIHNTLNSLLPYIQQFSYTIKAHTVTSQLKGMVERVAVNFFNSEGIPLERFMFKVNVKKQCYDGAMMDLESSLRSFFIKLSSSKMAGDCQDWRWEITGYFGRKDTEDRWIATRAQQWQQPPLITPIKSLNIDPFSMQLYLEHPTNPSIAFTTPSIGNASTTCQYTL